MAYEQAYSVLTLEAAADFTGDQFTFKIINTDGRWADPGGAAAVCQGVLLNEPNALGAPAECAMISRGGVCKVKTNGSVEAGDPVGCLDATGVAREAAQNDYILGYALEGDGGVVGAIIPVEPTHNQRLP